MRGHLVNRDTWYYELNIDKGFHHNKPDQHPVVGVGEFYFERWKTYINCKKKKKKKRVQSLEPVLLLQENLLFFYEFLNDE